MLESVVEGLVELLSVGNFQNVVALDFDGLIAVEDMRKRSHFEFTGIGVNDIDVASVFVTIMYSQEAEVTRTLGIFDRFIF